VAVLEGGVLLQAARAAATLMRLNGRHKAPRAAKRGGAFMRMLERGAIGRYISLLIAWICIGSS